MAGKYSFVSQDKFKDWLKAEGKPLDSMCKHSTVIGYIRKFFKKFLI